MHNCIVHHLKCTFIVFILWIDFFIHTSLGRKWNFHPSSPIITKVVLPKDQKKSHTVILTAGYHWEVIISLCHLLLPSTVSIVLENSFSKIQTVQLLAFEFLKQTSGLYNRIGIFAEPVFLILPKKKIKLFQNKRAWIQSDQKASRSDFS